jgi:hypothetical protein
MTHPPWFGSMRDKSKHSGRLWLTSTKEKITGPAPILRLRSLAVVSTSACLNWLSFTPRSAHEFIQAGNLQFVPTYGRPPEFSDDLHETLVALSQLIYWVNYLFLMCGGPEPRATAKLEKEFRQELPVGDIASFFLYTELICYCSELIRFSLRSVL